MACKDKVIHNPLSGQTIRFLQTSSDTDGELLEMESGFAPYSIEPFPHYHPQQEELFTVIEGQINVRINGSVKQLKKGDQLRIGPKTVHSMWNASSTQAVVNWKVTPALSTEYFLETGIGLAAAGKVNQKGMPPVLQTALLARKYKNVFRLARPPYVLQRLVFGALAPISKLAGYKAVYQEYLD